MDYHSQLVSKLRPDVTVLAGDVVFDGFTMLRAKAYHSVLPIEEELSILRNEKPGSIDWIKRQNALVHRVSKTSEYKRTLEALVRKHVAHFNEFLRAAAQESKALIVQGNHDDDYDPGYNTRRIKNLGGFEISGKTIEIDGFVFLGLGFNQALRIGTIRPILEKVVKRYRQVDVIVMHYPKSRLTRLTSVAPMIAIVGGAGPGEYLVDGIRTILTDSEGYLIDLSKTKSPKVSRVGVSEQRRMMKPFSHQHEEALFKTSHWLKPYPEKVGFVKS
jgi:Icc-related predicted phosphoesterase